MLLSRIFSSIALKYQNRFILNNSRCFLSDLSSKTKSDQENNVINSSDSIVEKKPIDENNEWLWTYLREQKNFSDLTEQQRRRVIEIGKIIDLSFVFFCMFSFIL